MHCCCCMIRIFLHDNVCKHSTCKCHHSLSSDHPINPPITDDPFQCDFLDDGGYCLKAVNGVTHVYKNEEDLLNDSPLDFPYPQLQEFLTDQNIMFALMSDGPMWVSINQSPSMSPVLNHTRAWSYFPGSLSPIVVWPISHPSISCTPCWMSFGNPPARRKCPTGTSTMSERSVWGHSKQDIYYLFMYIFMLSVCPGWHSRSCFLLHEPEAPASLHQKQSQTSA